MTGVPAQVAITQSNATSIGLLLPFWQLIIGILVLLALIASVGQLARRGPSRMTRALLVIATAILGLALVGILFQNG